MTFREKVLQLLYNKRITKSDLAEQLGKSRANVSIILKKNNPNHQTIKEFAAVLEVDISELTPDPGDQVKGYNPEFDLSDEEFDRLQHQNLLATSVGNRFLMFVAQMDFTAEEVEEQTNIKLDSSFFKRDFPRELSENEIVTIVSSYKFLEPFWLLTGKGEMLKSQYNFDLIRDEDHTEFRKLGERYLIFSPLIEAHGQMAYIAKNQDPAYIAGLPHHGIVLDNVQLGTYRSFKVIHENNSNKDGFKIPPEEMIFAGDILTARKIDHKAPNFSIDVWKHKDLVIVTKNGISTDRISARSFMDSLRTVPMVLKNDDGKEFTPNNPDDVLEVFVVVSITRYQK